MTQERKVAFGDLGFITFTRTYARTKKDGSKESFSETVERELKGIEKQLKLNFTNEEKEFYRDMRHKMLGSVAGRFMWQLGTKTVDKLGLPSLQNCFTGDTEFVTSEGIKKFSDFKDGDKVIIKGNLSWKEATVKSFGKQETVALTVRRGNSKRTEVIFTTANHRWIVGNKFGKKQSIKTTSELTEGMILQQTALRTNTHNIQICNVGQQHGLVFGDGHYNENAQCCAFVPCGDSIDEYKEVFHFTGDTKEITGLPNNWKEIPSYSMNKHYLLGFLSGWFAADGCVEKNGTLTLSNKSREVLMEAKGLFAKLDIYTSEPKLSREKNPFDGSESELWKLSINRDNINDNFFILQKHKERFVGYSKPQLWKVVSVESTGLEEDVFCVSEPDKEEFTLSNGILTKNCAFVVIDDPIKPFTWAMDMLMLGSGVGYSIKREHVYKLPKVKRGRIKIERWDDKQADFIVPDTREGWVKLLGKVLKAYFYSGEGFTYSTQLVRDRGEKIEGFGGVASGAGILVEGMNYICEVLDKRKGKQLRPIDCLDIMNIIGMIVVAGNVRRSAQIAIGDYDDLEYLKAKRWDLGQIPKWRAMSNNSVDVHDVKDLPQEFWDTYQQGEPYGLINLELSRKVGRLGETQYPDPDVEGYNPCAEQSLNNFETCCLAEIYLPNIKDYETFKKVMTMLYRVNKHSLALKSHQKETEKVVNKNMRMGIGVTGVMMATEEQLSWLKPAYEYLREYDKTYSKVMGFPESIKLTTVKPSGTLSLLAGVTSGVHPATAGRYFIRRIRIASDSPLVEVIKSHGYHTEYQKNLDGSDDYSTIVAEFPCQYNGDIISADEMSVFEQLDTVKFMQENWSDNSVSVTAYYKKEELDELREYLEENFKDNFKTLSFLLYSGHGFAQAPFEPITKEQYEYLSAKVKPITSAEIHEDDMEELGSCGIGSCPVR
jgi:ribonucleotide reductase alpha subunit